MNVPQADDTNTRNAKTPLGVNNSITPETKATATRAFTEDGPL
jgi:hypothetical protein